MAENMLPCGMNEYIMIVLSLIDGPPIYYSNRKNTAATMNQLCNLNYPDQRLSRGSPRLLV